MLDLLHAVGHGNFHSDKCVSNFSRKSDDRKQALNILNNTSLQRLSSPNPLLHHEFDEIRETGNCNPQIAKTPPKHFSGLILPAVLIFQRMIHNDVHKSGSDLT